MRSSGRYLALVLPVALPVVLAGVTRPADAKCAAPGIALSHPAGATLPPNPTVYAFVPSFAKATLDVLGDGQPVHADIAEASRSEAYVAYRVAITGATRGRVTLRVKSNWDTRSATYHIDPSWQPEAQKPPAVLSSVRNSDSWTCSYSDEYRLTVAPSAPAYRVEWATSRADYATGQRHSAVFPRGVELFWGGEAKLIGHATPGTVTLGHSNCFGWTIPQEVMDGCLRVGITALYPDGSEVAITGAPVAFACENDHSLIPEPPAPGPAATPEIEPEPYVCGYALQRRRADRLESQLAWIVGAAALGFLALLLGTRRALRRVPGDRVARVRRLRLPHLAVVTSGAAVVLATWQAGAYAHALSGSALIAAAAVAGASLGAALATLLASRR